MSTHNLCFRAKIIKNVYPCTPHFYYIKVGCKGVYISRTCLHDDCSACVDPMLICAFAARLCNMLWRGSLIYIHVGYIVYMFCLIRWNVPRMSHPGLALAGPFGFSSSMIILFTCRGRAVT